MRFQSPPARRGSRRPCSAASHISRGSNTSAATIDSTTIDRKDLDGEPVDQDGIVSGAQRHGVEPAVDGGRALAAFADGLTMFLQFDALQVLSNRLMRSWLAGEDEVAAGILDGGDDELAATDRPEIDRPEVSDRVW